MSTMVDLMPNISPTGDFKKISDNSTYNNNNKVALALCLFVFLVFILFFLSFIFYDLRLT